MKISKKTLKKMSNKDTSLAVAIGLGLLALAVAGTKSGGKKKNRDRVHDRIAARAELGPYGSHLPR